MKGWKKRNAGTQRSREIDRCNLPDRDVGPGYSAAIVRVQ